MDLIVDCPGDHNGEGDDPDTHDDDLTSLPADLYFHHMTYCQISAIKKTMTINIKISTKQKPEQNCLKKMSMYMHS